MSNPQNPYGSDGNNPNGQNPNNQPPSAPGYGNDQNSGQQPPQYGSQQQQNYGQGGNDGSQGYGQQAPQYGSQPQGGSQPQYGAPNDQNQYGQNAGGGQDQGQYGSQPQYGQNQYVQDQNQYGSPNSQNYDQGGYDQNQYGSQPQYGQNQYVQDQYGQNPYDANAQNQYDPNQYGQQPAYPGAGGGSDQFIPANPNAAYGQFPSGTGGNTSKNVWGILALIGGIVGVGLSFVFGSGFLFGAAAVVFGFVGLNAVKKGTASNKGFNITGLILGFASMLISIIVVILLIFGIGLIGKAASEEASKSAAAEDPTSQTDPSQGSGGSDNGGAPAQGGEVEIGDDVTATMSVRDGTAGDYASGAEESNGDIAIVTMTVKNDSSSEVKMTLTDMTATDGSGKEYDDVIDGSNYKGSLAFTDPVPAGGEQTYELAFGVPKDEIDDMHIELSLMDDLGKGKDFEFKQQ
jgi:hypothetical protein